MAVSDFEGEALGVLREVAADVSDLRVNAVNGVLLATVAAPLLSRWLRAPFPNTPADEWDAEILRPVARYCVRLAKILCEEAGRDNA